MENGFEDLMEDESADFGHKLLDGHYGVHGAQLFSVAFSVRHLIRFELLAALSSH